MRHILTLIAAVLCVVAYAQKKPNINKAKAALDNGDLTEAKIIIDQATTYEKTKDKAKTWYYRGMIYAAIDTSTNDPEAMKVAMESYNKSLELDPEQSSTSEFTPAGIVSVDSRITDYYAYYYNKGLDDYQSESYLAAADNFEKAFYIAPTDSNAVLNAAFSAKAAGDEERAKRNYEKVLETGMKDITIYLTLYNYAIQEEDLDKALEILARAKKEYPQNVDLIKYEINILIQQDKIAQAKGGVEEAIASEPDNPDLHFTLGVIKEELKDADGARASYNKAIAIDPEHFNSNYNLGAMAYNECVVLIKEKGALSYKETKKIDAVDKKLKVKLNATVPYWEKLYNLKNDDEKILETLQYIYVQLRMYDKANKIGDELDALRGEDGN